MVCFVPSRFGAVTAPVMGATLLPPPAAAICAVLGLLTDFVPKSPENALPGLIDLAGAVGELPCAGEAAGANALAFASACLAALLPFWLTDALGVGCCSAQIW